MKKYIYCIAMAVLTMVLLTGCGAGIELSDEENAMVAEYMAAALLKYDAHYEDELIYAEAAEVVEESKEEFVPVPNYSKEGLLEFVKDQNVKAWCRENGIRCFRGSSGKDWLNRCHNRRR